MHSSKGYFNNEDTLVRRNYWLGVPTTALGAIAGAVLIKSRLNACHGFPAPSIISLYSYGNFTADYDNAFTLSLKNFILTKLKNDLLWSKCFATYLMLSMAPTYISCLVAPAFWGAGHSVPRALDSVERSFLVVSMLAKPNFARFFIVTSSALSNLKMPEQIRSIGAP